ncbi:hypothetical protein BD626DRAFT_574172 [Schizophyllum amplum]|uniref:Uncharacterized protein n=1 Tax=Schizophyllum amplum TaxID=97359 RepID=A0A550BZA7_9AGAR|nr:hypothetical protein BD626DRAFT_574172 [Auriculariopsis ampla]
MPSAPGPLTAASVAAQKWTAITVGVQMALYGVHAALFLISLSALYHRSPRNVALRAATTAIFTCASISFIGWLSVYVIRTALDGTNPPSNASQAMDGILVASLIAQRVMLFIADLISSWRAWVIWMRSRRIAVVLGICLSGIIVGSTLEVSLYFHGIVSGNRNFAQVARILLTIIPGLVTNIVTTALAGYRTWTYRRLAKAGSAGSSRRRAPNRVERMLVLLAESGALYVMLWAMLLAVYMHTYVTGEDNNGLANLIQIAVGEGTALIPTLVIIAVALQRSQADTFATMSSATLSRSIHFRTGPLVVDTDSLRGSLFGGAESHAGSSPACETSEDTLGHAESTAVYSDDMCGILLRPMGGQRVLDSVDTGTDATLVDASVGDGAAARTGGSRRQSLES